MADNKRSHGSAYEVNPQSYSEVEFKIFSYEILGFSTTIHGILHHYRSTIEKELVKVIDYLRSVLTPANKLYSRLSHIKTKVQSTTEPGHMIYSHIMCFTEELNVYRHMLMIDKPHSIRLSIEKHTDSIDLFRRIEDLAYKDSIDQTELDTIESQLYWLEHQQENQ